MNKIIIILGLMAGLGLTGSCSSDKSDKEAAALYERAENFLNNGQIKKARAGLDSLNKLYPTAIEVREKGIILKSRIALKEAQDSLQLADSLLQSAKKGGASAREVALRQAHFDILVQKVRFYYKKIDKLNSLKSRMDSGENE